MIIVKHNVEKESERKSSLTKLQAFCFESVSTSVLFPFPETQLASLYAKLV